MTPRRSKSSTDWPRKSPRTPNPDTFCSISPETDTVVESAPSWTPEAGPDTTDPDSSPWLPKPFTNPNIPHTHTTTTTTITTLRVLTRPSWQDTLPEREGGVLNVVWRSCTRHENVFTALAEPCLNVYKKENPVRHLLSSHAATFS